MPTPLPFDGVLSLATGASFAQPVALCGMVGQALMDGTPPRFLSVGQSPGRVELLSVEGDAPTVELQGQRKTSRFGSAPLSVAKCRAGGGGQRIVLTADPCGHFSPQGQINGKAAQFVLDTGAITVSLGAPDARRINLKYAQGQKVQRSAPNGNQLPGSDGCAAPEQRGGGDFVEVHAPIVLPGNRFQIQKTNDQMTLDKRYGEGSARPLSARHPHWGDGSRLATPIPPHSGLGHVSAELVPAAPLTAQIAT